MMWSFMEKELAEDLKKLFEGDIDENRKRHGI